MKNILKVTILFCILILCMSVIVFADYGNSFTSQPLPVGDTNSSPDSGFLVYDEDINNSNSYVVKAYSSNNSTYLFYASNIRYGFNNIANAYVYCSTLQNTVVTSFNFNYKNGNPNDIRTGTLSLVDASTGLYFYVFNGAGHGNTENLPAFTSLQDGFDAVVDYIENPPAPPITKNPNVDEFIANTLISLGIHYNQYSDALSIASSAWNYIIDDDNWYIGSGDRNDKSITWDIDSAVSYANAQSNNYMDWYNGYKVNKDLTVALAKFISDNYTASTVGEGTLAGYSVKYNSNYNYGTTSGTSGFDGNFGSSPNALSFYPASTITYFNGAYLHDNDIIDQDEFVYSPADVRKFIGYPSTSGIIESPDNTPASGTITDGNGDTVYNIDLDFPSLDWLADAIQSVLDFLNNLLTTIADFLTQILDAILSLFSDAFESLTEFGNGLIEWLYSVVSSFSTLGSNYIPASLWSVLLPFIFLNIGVGLIMFVLRSH